ncbi:hypothetical protein ODZ83_08890 [Acaricomes phytoseiuli]|uniref:hypothetical protein n=1 Tax=Acaricomes phytoseiuli TaxID=291968 RepID=UPI0014613EC4|nr:hypothetical protein [Acaricomes phytoseiuli]MCW1250290.1 hypothetical protein [Acaricomes phytoseiuli]
MISFALSTYAASIPDGSRIVVLARNEKLGRIYQKRLGLERLLIQGEPTLAYGGVKQSYMPEFTTSL